jgi:hypothetical protein
LDEKLTHSFKGGAPPRRARKAGLLVQEIIDPILNEASEICQEFAKFHTFISEVETNLHAAIRERNDGVERSGGVEGAIDTSHARNNVATAATTTTTTGPTAHQSIQKIREAGQELMIGYMMVEAYCVTRNQTQSRTILRGSIGFTLMSILL